MEFIIGMDFGNFFSQLCVIMGIDPVTKKGGIFHDLTDPSANIPYGIPTAFFYSKNQFGGQPVCGVQAVRGLPPSNCYRYLKRDMMTDGKANSVTIDGRTFTYDEMIVAAAQYALRMAATQLKLRFNIVTNKVSLAYPASISADARNHLVSLIERVTLEDGQKIEVVGTIAEPAAAALDWLAQQASTEDRTVLVYDFGAGTFDVSVVEAYPRGRTAAGGNTYYYDVLFTDGLPNVGGSEIDKEVQGMLTELAGEDAKDPRTREQIRVMAESIKRDLSAADRVQPNIPLSNGNYIGEITRTAFEERIAPIVKKTVDMVRQALEKNADLKVDEIVLTGGSSQIPLVMRMLEEALPAFKGKIRFHQPSKAISAGAARFGVRETIDDPCISGDKKTANTVVVRTIRDMGVRFFDSKTDQTGYVTTYIPAGTEVPHTTEWHKSYKLDAGDFSRFRVYEANCSAPESRRPDRDYAVVCDHRHDHGQVRPVDYPSETRIVIDERHMAHLEVRDPNHPKKTSVSRPFSIDKNLQS